jgi:2-methylcitrate dehydratase PrpD
MALLGDDTADPVAYSDRRIADPSLVALRDRVTVVPDGTLPATRSVVTVAMDDGRTLVASDDTGQPAADLGQQERRLVAKFRTLAVPVVEEGSTSAIVDAVLRSDPRSWTARQLAGLLAGSSGADER